MPMWPMKYDGNPPSFDLQRSFLRFIGVRSTLQLGSVNPYIYWVFVRLTIKRILKEEGIITWDFLPVKTHQLAIDLLVVSNRLMQHPLQRTRGVVSLPHWQQISTTPSFGNIVERGLRWSMELKLDEEGLFTYEGHYKERKFVRKGDCTWKGYERSMYKEGVMVHFLYCYICVSKYREIQPRGPGQEKGSQVREW